MSQQKLAERIYADPGRKGDISRIENAKVVPQEKTVARLCEALDITEDEMAPIRSKREADLGSLRIKHVSRASLLQLAAHYGIDDPKALPNDVLQERLSEKISQIGPRSQADFFSDHLDLTRLIERLHRLMLDVIKDEFERIGYFEINAVQALLIHNIGEQTVTAGELKSRGYYQGSNVSYNLKKLVELGYLEHRKSEEGRWSVVVYSTKKGLELSVTINILFLENANAARRDGILDDLIILELTEALRRVERFWVGNINSIY